MIRMNTLIDVKIAVNIFITTTVLTICFCLFIVFLIILTKNIHSPANLLVCNTCLSTIFFCIATTFQVYFFYLGSVLTDCSCRILSYFAYVALYMVTYSYLIQALSRFFYIFYPRHQYLLLYKSHIIFILCEIFISFLIPLPSLITKDVIFRQLLMCFVPTEQILHIIYILISSYIFPLLIMIVMYTVIYYRVVKSSMITRHSSHIIKRDLDLIRNTLILFAIFLLAGIPTLIYTIISFKISVTSKGLYMLPVISASIAVLMEKIIFIIIHKDILKEVKRLFQVSDHSVVHPL